MIANRSVPAASVLPVLAYAHVALASDWFCNAFGLPVKRKNAASARMRARLRRVFLYR